MKIRPHHFSAERFSVVPQQVYNIYVCVCVCALYECICVCKCTCAAYVPVSILDLGLSYLSSSFLQLSPLLPVLLQQYQILTILQSRSGYTSIYWNVNILNSISPRGFSWSSQFSSYRILKSVPSFFSLHSYLFLHAVLLLHIYFLGCLDDCGFYCTINPILRPLVSSKEQQ